MSGVSSLLPGKGNRILYPIEVVGNSSRMAVDDVRISRIFGLNVGFTYKWINLNRCFKSVRSELSLRSRRHEDPGTLREILYNSVRQS